MYIPIPKIISIGPLAAAAEVISCGRTDRQNHRPLLWIGEPFGKKKLQKIVNYVYWVSYTPKSKRELKL